MDTGSVARADLFDALGDHVRRQLVDVLADCDADTVGWDHVLDRLDERVSTADADSLRIRLYHLHVPKLEAAGVLAFDTATRRLAPGPRFDAAKACLARTQ